MIKIDRERLEMVLREHHKDQLIEYPHNDETRFTIDYTVLVAYYVELADALVTDYKVVNRRVTDIVKRCLNPPLSGKQLKVNYKDIPDVLPISMLHSRHNNELVCFEGVVKRRSATYQECTHAAWECNNCHAYNTYRVGYGELLYPPKQPCEKCGHKSGYKFNHKHSLFKDVQRVEITEPLSSVGGGYQPEVITVYFEDDMTNTVVPGDKVQVNGLLEVRNSKKKNLFNEYVVVEHVQHLEYKFEDIILTDEEKREIISFSRRDDLFRVLSENVVPSIYGYDMVKLGLLLQLFGADSRDFHGSTKRGDIHVLIVGDPGIGKSQILKYISELAPRGIYTSGKGSTGAGLTATAVKDELGRWDLEAGALVLGDKGNVCIDEFDKMREDDRSAIHEALEQQTISLSKAGITTTMNSRCSVLAAANPVFGRINPYKNISEQLNLSQPILSRFDLIFIIEDKNSEDEDKDLTTKILEGYMTSKEDGREISKDLLRKYISYARRNIHPEMTAGVVEYFRDHYVGLRSLARLNNHPIPITTRQLEALVRLAEASARIRLSDKIELEDAERAVELQQYCIQCIGFDEEKAVVDIDKVESGNTKSKRESLSQSVDILAKLEEDWDEVPDNVFRDSLEQSFIGNPGEVIGTLYEENMIIQPHRGYWRRA